LVADAEVLGTADDAADVPLPGAVVAVRVGTWTDIDLAPADGLAVRLWFIDEFEHLAHHDGTGHSEAVFGLLLEPDSHERRVQVLRGHRVGQVDVLREPAHRNPHQPTSPNWAEKRTSPSIMSRMSLMSFRNIRVRSM